ncbi:MAG: Hsp20/alpha crystallin family protein [Alphaproteobacteria bacterium]|nr:Hsp20/alpha crystallin family protein [Alphaproteobacteria bacterium]
MTEHNVAVAGTPAATPAAPANGHPEAYTSPPVDIYETADGFVLAADLPGVSQDSLEVSVTRNVLTIKGRLTGDLPGKARYREFQPASVFRQFRLGNALDTDLVDARLNNGVLRLRIPKAGAAVARQIDIKVA